MTRLTNRAKRKTNRVELPDASALRARIVDAVEEAIDRAEQAYERAGDALGDAPSAREAARRVRNTRAMELAGMAFTAGLPIVTSKLQQRAARKTAARVATLAPVVVVRSHPVLLGASVVGGAAIGTAVALRMRSKRRAAERNGSGETGGMLGGSGANPSRLELDDEVARMEDEGGEPSGQGGGIATEGRHFVRSSNGGSQLAY